MKAFVVSAELARILKDMDSKDEFQEVIEWHGLHRAIYLTEWYVMGEMEPDSVDSDSMVSYTDYTTVEAQSIISKNNDVSHALRSGYMIDMLKNVIDGRLDISLFYYSSKNQLQQTLFAMCNLTETDASWLGDDDSVRYTNAVDLTARLMGFYERS